MREGFLASLGMTDLGCCGLNDVVVGTTPCGCPRRGWPEVPAGRHGGRPLQLRDGTGAIPYNCGTARGLSPTTAGRHGGRPLQLRDGTLRLSPTMTMMRS